MNSLENFEATSSIVKDPDTLSIGGRCIAEDGWLRMRLTKECVEALRGYQASIASWFQTAPGNVRISIELPY